ncbi:MAG: hypothetical protein BGP06_15295 [Rhizobiales bacterium 65-9]|nr:hypothetical protein [Hyphomicrobiales bacterium]OJY37862.1 MAG: hypothetical protein BGP06_15295 [Rhizobiales bacterium 65-9]
MDSLRLVVEAVIARGDLAHLVLALWAGGATLLCVVLARALTAANDALGRATREVSDANRHVKDFVRELTRFNRRNAA